MSTLTTASFAEALNNMKILDEYARFYATAPTRLFPLYDPNEPKRAVFMNDIFGFLRDQIGDFARWLYKKSHGLDPLTTIRDLRHDLSVAEQGQRFLRGELANANRATSEGNASFKALYNNYNELRIETQKLAKRGASAAALKRLAKFGIVAKEKQNV